MATLIANGTGAANSADFILSAGSTSTLSLVTGNAGDDVPADAVALVQVKATSGGGYFTIGQLDYRNKSLVLSAAGTFRVSKPMSAAAYGVERD